MMSNHRSKRLCVATLQPSINSSYLESKFMKNLSNVFRIKKEKSFRNGAHLISSPFCLTSLENFVEPADYVNQLKDDVDFLPMKSLASDLYQFQQSDDFANIKNITTSRFRQFLIDHFLPWLRTITNFELNDDISISASSYTYTDHLLCHDDRLEGRKVAFIYYPTDWEQEYGGLLRLFDTIGNHPNKCVKSIVPSKNKMIFFEVSETSFHEVSEVLCEGKRLAISGWFYTTNVPVIPNYILPLLPRDPPKTEILLEEWLNPMYCRTNIILQIMHELNDTNAIMLENFLKNEKYTQVCAALESHNDWVPSGPAERKYFFENASKQNWPPIIVELMHFYESFYFFNFLSDLADMPLFKFETGHSVVGEKSTVLSQFKCGCYTSLPDYSCTNDGVHCNLYFSCGEWSEEYGGITQYVVERDDATEETHQMFPADNCFYIVKPEQGTKCYVKYLNDRSKNKSNGFYSLFSTYARQSGYT